MKKKIKGKKGAGILSVALLMTVFLAACGTEKEEDWDWASHSATPTTAVRSSGGDTSIADELFVTAEKGKEFYVMRVKDSYLEIPGSCKNILLGANGEYPEMEDGQIVRVVADVYFLNGGVAGYCNNISIEELISSTDVDYTEALSQLSIPDAGTTVMDYNNKLLRYDIGGRVFLITVNEQYIEAYTEEGPYMEYEYNATRDDRLEPFFEQVAREDASAGAMILPDLSEDEILNMSDADFWYYGNLAAEHLLGDAATPNLLRSDFGLYEEDGYRVIGRSAERSAADSDAAKEAAEEYWKPLGKNTFEDIRLIAETDEFRLFAADHYFDGKFSMIDTLQVYKTDYYDAESSVAGFALDEENFRHFIAYGTADPVAGSECCIGEYVTEDEEKLSLRRYQLHISFGDYGVNDEVYLDVREWQIRKADAVVSFIGETWLREAEIPYRIN